MSAFHLAMAGATAQAAAVATLLNSGYLRIYTGPQPDTADTAITAQLVLATLRFQPEAASSVVDGMATFAPLIPDINADAAGTAVWFRCTTAAGETVFDGSVGEDAPADLIISSVSVNPSFGIAIAQFTYTVPPTGA